MSESLGQKSNFNAGLEKRCPDLARITKHSAKSDDSGRGVGNLDEI